MPCSWIVEEGISEQQLLNRYSKWCEPNKDGARDNCPLACGDCNPAPKTCEDVEGFTLNVNTQIPGVTKDVPCSWIVEEGISEQRLLNRYSKWCVPNKDGARDNCPLACGECEKEDEIPEGTKSLSATKSPTGTKSPSATKSPKDSKAPSATKSPKKTKAPKATKCKKPKKSGRADVSLLLTLNVSTTMDDIQQTLNEIFCETEVTRKLRAHRFLDEDDFSGILFAEVDSIMKKDDSE